jgi:rhodanese-related sulfurtransferase
MAMPPTVDPHQLHELSQTAAAPMLIDVRTPGEFETVHIPGSYNVPLGLLREHRKDLAERLHDVVLVCRSGQRSATAEEALRRAGLINVRILDGGLTAWQTSGYDVARGTPRWDLERQVRLVAGFIVALSILIGVVVPGVQWIAFAVGVGLTAAAITNTCAMGNLLSRLPYNRADTCNANNIVDQLVGSEVRGR